jgi:hypothetical protein
MKKLLIPLLVLVMVSSCIGGVAYADNVDDSVNSSVVAEPTDEDITTSEDTSASSGESQSGDENQALTIGESAFNIVVSHDKDDCYTALDELLDLELPEGFSDSARTALTSKLKSLIVDLMSNGGYTLEAFKVAFVLVLQSFGIEVSEEFVDAIIYFASYYFNDDFEQEDNEVLLVWIGSSLSMMVTLFLTSQNGGVHRGY